MATDCACLAVKSVFVVWGHFVAEVGIETRLIGSAPVVFETLSEEIIRGLRIGPPGRVPKNGLRIGPPGRVPKKGPGHVPPFMDRLRTG